MNDLMTCQSSRYLYALIKTTDAELLQTGAPDGMGGAPIEMIAAGDITAVASATAETKIRPQRRFLATHQQVVNWVAERCSMLPVAFGLIAEDPDSVIKVIDSNSPTLLEQLAVVDGKVEMSLTLRWAVDNVFQYFVSQYDDLKQASLAIARGEATRDEQIELGRLFERLLNSERENHTAHVLEKLACIVVKNELQPQRDEFDIMRLACLINRSDVEAFSDKVFEIAKDFSDDYGFAFNGPWAPYSFVSLSLFLND
jgi:hypothetical protein